MYHFLIKQHEKHLKYAEISLLSRDTLKECFLKYNITIPNKTKINLINYDYIDGFEQFSTSISHTKNFHCAIISSKKNYISIGIDLEIQGRKTSPEIIERISHKNDLPVDPKDYLRFWTKKEAAFKALSPLNSDVRFLKDFWIVNNKFGLQKNVLGNISTKEIEFNKIKLILSIALIH